MNPAPPSDGAPQTVPPPASASPRGSRSSPRAKGIPGGRVVAGLFGILLPLCALGFELATGMAREVIDPIPTVAHAFAIAFVPLAHLAALLALGDFRFRPTLRLAAHLNSAACAIALAYAVLFLPITPFAFIAILALGIGLLALSPLSAFIVSFLLRVALRRRAAGAGERLPSFWPGFIAGLLALAALETPSFLTEHFVQQLDRATPGEQSAALGRLRMMTAFGGETQLLRGSYGLPRGGLLSGDPRPGFRLFNAHFTQAPEEETFRLAYYRVTGRAYNSVPAPRRSLFAVRDRADTEDVRDWVWDDSLGTQQVGRRLRALGLAESRLDARLDGDAALGYLEWTLVFRNDHAFDQREARALVQLPPGAAVSRLTLWVHGEEREASWGGPAKVVQAYRSVAVVQRHDPVLVTAQGPDRVLLQCFPIEPRGGLMKVRLGITLPLALADSDRADLLLPRFIEQNFSVADSVSHQLWVDADAPLTPNLAALHAEGSLVRPALRGPLSPADLAAGLAPLSLARSPASAFAWTPALRDPTRVVTQTLRRQPPPSGDIALLVSGSGELAPAAAALAKALRQAESTPFVRIHHSGDEAAESPAGLDASAQARWLEARPFAGGQDDTQALATALDALAARGGGTLVWVHGGQPICWQNPSALEQRLARRGGLVRIVSVPAVAAPNLLLEKVAAAAPLTTFPLRAGPDADFARLVSELRDGRLVAERSSRDAAGFVPVGKRASDHLSRLWAHDEVKRLLSTGEPAARESAQALAVATQIVTPVSGAVVLETDAQYKANGLEAPDAKNSPAVPEPAAYGLLMSGALLVFSLFHRRPRAPSRSVSA